MSDHLCDAWEVALLNQIFRQQALPVLAGAPQGRLFSADPGESGSLSSELTALDYAAQSLVFGAASGGVANTTQATVWTSAAGPGWGTPAWLGVCTQAVGGQMIFRAPLVPASIVPQGDPCGLAAGEIGFSIRALGPGSLLSLYTINRLINQFLRGVATTWPAAVWLGLSRALPGADASGLDEVSTVGTGYSRKQAGFGAASGGRIAPSASVNYGNAGSAWGVMRALTAHDAAVGGNLLASAPLLDEKVVNSGTPVQLDAETTFFSLG